MGKERRGGGRKGKEREGGRHFPFQAKYNKPAHKTPSHNYLLAQGKGSRQVWSWRNTAGLAQVLHSPPPQSSGNTVGQGRKPMRHFLVGKELSGALPPLANLFTAFSIFALTVSGQRRGPFLGRRKCPDFLDSPGKWGRDRVPRRRFGVRAGLALLGAERVSCAIQPVALLKESVGETSACTGRIWGGGEEEAGLAARCQGAWGGGGPPACHPTPQPPTTLAPEVVLQPGCCRDALREDEPLDIWLRMALRPHRGPLAGSPLRRVGGGCGSQQGPRTPVLFPDQPGALHAGAPIVASTVTGGSAEGGSRAQAGRKVGPFQRVGGLPPPVALQSPDVRTFRKCCNRHRSAELRLAVMTGLDCCGLGFLQFLNLFKKYFFTLSR